MIAKISIGLVMTYYALFSIALEAPRIAVPGEPEVHLPASPEDVVGFALEAWSQFTSTGAWSLVDAVFIPGGAQYEQLAGESPSGSPPLRFVAEQTVIRSLATGSATVWARVRVEREGYQPEVFHWDFDLVRTGEGWRVWTVVPAERPDEVEPSSTTPTTTGTTGRSLTQTRESSSPLAAETPSNGTTGIRLPALSAWIIVITIAGVALAGYLAPRIDRRRER